MSINNAHITEVEKRILRWWVEKTYVKSSRYDTESNTSKLKHLFEDITGHYIYEDSAKALMKEWGYRAKDENAAQHIYKLKWANKEYGYSSRAPYNDASRFGALLRAYKEEHDDTVE